MVTLAVAFQIALVLYHQGTTSFDFFPFNGARFYSGRERLLEAGINLLLMSLPLLGFLQRVPLLMKFGVIYYFILFAVECATWWAPYFFGPSAKALEAYNRIHRQTITLLPRRGSNPTPNLEHLILMALTLITALFTLMAFRSVEVSFGHWWVGVIIGIGLSGGTALHFCYRGSRKSNGLAA
ncbi:MAG: hypothetical protein ACLPQ6_03495 [Steroidobacteraceae bacterium]